MSFRFETTARNLLRACTLRPFQETPHRRDAGSEIVRALAHAELRPPTPATRNGVSHHQYHRRHTARRLRGLDGIRLQTVGGQVRAAPAIASDTHLRRLRAAHDRRRTPAR